MPRFFPISNKLGIENQHHFGYPTYVLKKELQDKNEWSKEPE
jgi:hypothetical protein